MLKRFVRIFGGDPNKRVIEKYSDIVDEINALEPDFEKLSDEQLAAKTAEFRARLAQSTNGLTDEKEIYRAQQETLEDILPEAFAAVREASKRTIGLRHYDVQLIGGIALHLGKIAEMRTGEGKTLVATLPLYLNALAGRGAHLVTVNDYLARRDARWMGPIYRELGLSVGVLQMAARTENGRKAFLVDLERESPHEDQDQLRMVDRKEAYDADITYGTNSEFGFDYLRDNMTMTLEERVQRGHHYAIVDEVDNVLIDEARTPLIISGPATDDTEWYVRMAQVVRRLRSEEYEISERDRTITLSEMGETHVEELLEMPLRDPERPEDVTPEQARLMGYLEQALRAQFLFKRNKDYLVQAGKVVIVDEFTGRLMPGRRWSDGLHQAVEAKEGVRVEAENVTYATITIQNYFRMYKKLAGMTGTAVTEAEEFDKIYKLDVLAIPTNLEYVASWPESVLVELEDRDPQGYKYQFYAQREDSNRQPVYWRRKDYPDVVYRTEEAKFRSVILEILGNHARGRPMLVGTTSVDLSERLSNRLRAEPLRRLAQVSLIRDAWFEKNHREEDGRQVSELQPLNAPLEQLQTPDLRKMAVEVGIPLNPEDPANAARLSRILGLEERDQERLVASLKAGIPHQVLNARKHTEESQIIAGAGAFGAVTIATNMAGRGVDIKLGGEMAEEVTSAVNRVLRRAGFEDPYDMSMEERRKALLAMVPADYGIYEAEIGFFMQQLNDMERVKSLGGLHVIGSERHEARRIDNQLRGRAARQGDPGSSRFYLSLEDELMVRFGGQQANDMMQRLRVDDAMPIEVGLVSRIVEQSQTRVEGANFDIRKHLLEYDDVLNTQRTKIYEQRDRIFTKEDLSEDVTEMLRTEVLERVPKSLQDDEGPWQLLAWLDEVQPPFTIGEAVYPSYMLELLLEQVNAQQPSNGASSPDLTPLLKIAEGSLATEEEHLMKAVNSLLDQIQDRLDAQMKERMDAVDTFFEGLRLSDETDTRGPRELAEELSGLVHFPLRLTPEQQRQLRSDPEALLPVVRGQVEVSMTSQATTRLVGAVERRIGEGLGLSTTELSADDWYGLAEQVRSATQALFARRRERLLGTGPNFMNGQIAKDLEATLAKDRAPLTGRDKELLAQGLKAYLSQPERDQTTQELRALLSKVEGALSEEDRDEIVDQVELALAKGSSPDQVAQTLQDTIQQIDEEYAEQRILNLLLLMPVGTQTSFDRKSHRRMVTRTVRLIYTYYAARFLERREPEEIAAEVLEHLEDSQAVIRQAWGRSEWKRLATYRPVEMDPLSQRGLRNILGAAFYQQYQDQPLQNLPVDLRLLAIDELGRIALTEVYRQLLLGVITELWVEYLTQMEALRVSIGLEAYAQRDPLVQYKSRAFEMFQALLSNLRLGVITRMFVYRPRSLASVQPAAHRAKELEGNGSQAMSEEEADAAAAAAGSNYGAEAETNPLTALEQSPHMGAADLAAAEEAGGEDMDVEEAPRVQAGKDRQQAPSRPSSKQSKSQKRRRGRR